LELRSIPARKRRRFQKPREKVEASLS
jgi:hypothetical protein